MYDTLDSLISYISEFLFFMARSMVYRLHIFTTTTTKPRSPKQVGVGLR
jgi:hypothetical protein